MLTIYSNLFEMDGYVRMSQILSREQIAEVLGAVEEVRARLPEEVPKEHQCVVSHEVSFDTLVNKEILKCRLVENLFCILSQSTAASTVYA